ncbi:hypothetical protein SETIT_3G026800v2 [Setaria italica]|uniref:Uncharacterized protein n=1 Tax=Setaria italica TaxID=4555 RepID=A0A368QAL3_SETIT|nr:hypothetical protein SETIT_3G026800v2 [Setaria italica]
MPDIKAVAAKLLDRSRRKEVESRQRETAASSAGGGASSAIATIVDRPLPIRFPPWNASLEDMHKWNLERRRIDKLVGKDPRTKLLENLPTLRKPKDPDTRDAVASSRDKRRWFCTWHAPSSVFPHGNFIWQCTGIVVGWDEAKKCARILTNYDIASDTGALLDPKPKIHVRLPNKIVSEGQLLFFNKHYNIALLEITADFLLQLPSFGSSPNYGQEVFVLARDEDSFLLARHGTIVWIDEPDYSSCNYHMFLSCELPGMSDISLMLNCNGMAFDCFKEYPAMLVSISTILTCIEMWMKFSRIARPIMQGLRLRSVELLDVSSREEISYSYNINSGYIVDTVRFNSTAEKVCFI